MATNNVFTSLRYLHRNLAWIMMILLTFMAISGGAWTVLFRLLKCKKESVKWLLEFHQGDFFGGTTGKLVRAPFCALVALLTILMIISGLIQISQKSMIKNRNKFRRFHQVLGLLLGLPLLVMAVTGSAWALARYVFEYDKAAIKWLLVLHQVLSQIKSFFFVHK